MVSYSFWPSTIYIITIIGTIILFKLPMNIVTRFQYCLSFSCFCKFVLHIAEHISFSLLCVMSWMNVEFIPQAPVLEHQFQTGDAVWCRALLAWCRLAKAGFWTIFSLLFLYTLHPNCSFPSLHFSQSLSLPLLSSRSIPLLVPLK